MRSAAVQLLSLASLAGGAVAQSSLYGQCGGNGWTGPTTCVSGSTCKYQNDWYSQCLPGSAPPVSTPVKTTTMKTTTKATPTTTKAVPTTTKPSNPPAGSGFPSAKGTLFTLDGVTNYFAGTNCYWCGFLTNNADVDSVFDHLQESGLKILRVWGFNDVNSKPGSGTVWYQYLSASGSEINTGANGLQRLDYVVDAATKRGIKLIINFVNNWDDYGGMTAYTNVFGGTHQGWYTNAAAQAQYRKYVQAIVSRYADSTGVLAWELGNEPRCNGCATDVIYKWASDTSAYIKSLDSNHMVTLGDEGMGLAGDGSYPYGFSEGVDFGKNLGISTLDFGTFHLYPNSWGTSYDWGNDWIKAHAALCAAAGKPCLFEEYGAPSDHCTIEKPWQQTSVAATGMAGDLFWQLGDTLSYGQSSDDGNTIYYGSSDWTCLVTDHVAAL